MLIDTESDSFAMKSLKWNLLWSFLSLHEQGASIPGGLNNY